MIEPPCGIIKDRPVWTVFFKWAGIDLQQKEKEI